MRHIRALVIAFVGLAMAYIAAAPYITVYRMKSAAQELDGEALSEYIEFPSVRQSLKDQMNAAFAKVMADNDGMKGNPFASLGVAFAGVLIDKMVDVYVTPAGMSQIMAGERPRQDEDPRADGGKKSERQLLPDASMAYESLDKFVVKSNRAEGGELRLVLRRRGLDWKLTEILLPLQ